MLQTCAGMDTLHSGRRSRRVPRTDRGQAQNPSQPVLDRSFCHVAGAISNLAGTGPVGVTELEAKRQPGAGVTCVTRAPHGSTAVVALQRVWGRSKYEFERPHGRSGPVTPPDLTSFPPNHRVVTHGSQRVTPPGEARLPARSRLPLRFGVAQFLLARHPRGKYEFPDVYLTLNPLCYRVNLNAASVANSQYERATKADQIRLIIAVRHGAVGALQASNRHTCAG